MAIKDKEMVALVEEQAQLWIKDGTPEQKVDVFKRIVKRQKQLMRGKKDE